MFARLVFGVRVAGRWLALVLLVRAGALAFAGIGLLVASRAQNTETVSGLMNLVMLPMFVLSGVFFSPTHFPAGHAAGHPRPAADRAERRLRAVMLEGAGLGAVVKPLLVMAVWGVVSFVAGLKLFRWA